MFSLDEKVIAITGGSSGIGAATAILLANHGHRVVLGARREDRLKDIVRTITDSKGQAAYAVTDVTKREDLRALVRHAQKIFGRIDVMINNAGIMPLSLFDHLKVDEWERMIDVNIKGVLYGIAASLPIFRTQGSGHIINVASLAAHQTAITRGVYGATKAAVLAISEGLRMETGGKLRVTVVSPGMTKSEISQSISHPVIKQRADTARAVAIEPDAVARSIAFAIEQPVEANVNEIVVGPTAQVRL